MNHKYRYGGRVTNWRTGVLSLTILMCAMLSYYGNQDNTYTREHEQKVVVSKIVHASTTEEKIAYYFPKHKATMIAVAKAESHMNMNAVGYNCMYNGKSMACKKEDRAKAWSRDCGLLQLNTTAKTCPKETIDEHLKRAADLSRVQGLGAWVTFNTGAHEKYLATNN